MLRKLKPHEERLLRKVDIYDWKREHNIREIKIIRRYHIQKREDYAKYLRLCGDVKKLTARLVELPPTDPVRQELTEQLLTKLFNMGLIDSKKSLAKCDQLTASSFCRRRLPVVMVRLKMSENLKQAVTYIEQGHVRVGPQIVTDPAFLVTRSFEDFVTWVDSSRVKEKLLKYNDQLDDFTLLGN